jgi:predicted nuclease of predicted toxin-antitoxin system
VKALFDENLSPDLVHSLSDIFPDSIAVVRVELKPKPISDAAIWHYARANGYFILSKDDDFEKLAILKGHPPKVVWLRCGNASNSEVEQFIRSHVTRIRIFLADGDASLLVLP